MTHQPILHLYISQSSRSLFLCSFFYIHATMSSFKEAATCGVYSLTDMLGIKCESMKLLISGFTFVFMICNSGELAYSLLTHVHVSVFKNLSPVLTRCEEVNLVISFVICVLNLLLFLCDTASFGCF